MELEQVSDLDPILSQGSCIQFQNAWMSDRTLCYLASGKPVVVQYTGPSAFLPNGEGMFRFSTVQEAARALEVINSDYEKHSRAARQIAETFFDDALTAAGILTWRVLRRIMPYITLIAVGM